MTLSVHRDPSGLSVLHDGLELMRVRYTSNRYHYHPRVFRLHFEQLVDGGLAELEAWTGRLLTELRLATADARPLFFRATLASESPLLDVLRHAGFLETRRVYEPWIRPIEGEDQPAILPAGLEVRPLADFGTSRQKQLLELYIRIYSRISRLDPATPELVAPAEWAQAFLDDPDLDRSLSCCVVAGDAALALMTVYRGEADGFELGPFGVAESRLSDHQDLTVAMLARVLRELRTNGQGTTRVTAEIDSDDPWTLYTCAEFPFHFGDESVSLVMVPAWRFA